MREKIAMGIDGKLWAEEFCQRFPQCEVDDVLGWFCNAIMAGYDEGFKVGREDLREDIIMLLGKALLTPAEIQAAFDKVTAQDLFPRHSDVAQAQIDKILALLKEERQ